MIGHKSTLMFLKTPKFWYIFLNMSGISLQEVLAQEFHLVQILQGFKVENRKKQPFYEVKMKTSKFRGWYYLN